MSKWSICGKKWREERTWILEIPNSRSQLKKFRTPMSDTQFKYVSICCSVCFPSTSISHCSPQSHTFGFFFFKVQSKVIWREKQMTEEGKESQDLRGIPNCIESRQ